MFPADDDFLRQIDAAEPADARRLLRRVVDRVRPAGVPLSGLEDAFLARVNALRTLLLAEPEHHAKLVAVLHGWLDGQHLQQALSHVGLLPRRGFMHEMRRRWYDTLNPPPRDTHSLSDTLRHVFHRDDDPLWVEVVGDEAWSMLLELLFDDGRGGGEATGDQVRPMLDALEKLAVWVAAEELETDLVRLDPKILERDSPFSALQREMAAFAADYRALSAGERAEYHDDAHLRVLLEQSVDALALYRRRSLSRGASIGLTYLLERLDQTLARIATLLDVVDLTPEAVGRARAARIRLFRQLVAASVQRNSLRALWRQNIGLLARNVSNNASTHGEHYVSSNRSGYLRMLRAAAGAGLIIPFMALFKLWIGRLGLPVLIEHVLYSLNYGLGFVLIHILGFAVATKQPAMTAAYFSGAMEREGRSTAAPLALVELLARVSRTQFIAIVGNVSIALLVAWLLARGWLALSGNALLGWRESDYLLASLHPWSGLAVVHAGIAGFWLFLSGLIAGYFDNRFVMLSLQQRFQQHPWGRRLLPRPLRERLGRWLAEHYGALWGNFLFGVMLGMTGLVGFLLGLPIDIRHVAFSAANVGLVLPSSPLDLGIYLMFALLVGLVNLAVSFGLALSVALRARGLRLDNPRAILAALWGKLSVAPTEFFLPPADADRSADASGQSGDKTPGARAEAAAKPSADAGAGDTASVPDAAPVADDAGGSARPDGS
ncbi:MAG: hypothetical protein Q4F49_04450 [Pseudoxanthomonas suwonensis]|nr:hypothetical protein [Pseudoxanthomonas suwonensis]